MSVNSWHKRSTISEKKTYSLELKVTEISTKTFSFFVAELSSFYMKNDSRGGSTKDLSSGSGSIECRHGDFPNSSTHSFSTAVCFSITGDQTPGSRRTPR